MCGVYTHTHTHTYIYISLNDLSFHLKLIEHCKLTILQLKKSKKQSKWTRQAQDTESRVVVTRGGRTGGGQNE